MGTVIGKMKVGPRPKGLSLTLEGLGIGQKAVVGAPKDRVRSTIQGATTWMNTYHPERRFELGNLGGVRTHVWRLADVMPPPWADLWAEIMRIEEVTPTVGRPMSTYVPRRHGFAMWARERGLGFASGDWWAWEHLGGWKAQKRVQTALRRAGVPARTWV